MEIFFKKGEKKCNAEADSVACKQTRVFTRKNDHKILEARIHGGEGTSPKSLHVFGRRDGLIVWAEPFRLDNPKLPY